MEEERKEELKKVEEVLVEENEEETIPDNLGLETGGTGGYKFPWFFAIFAGVVALIMIGLIIGVVILRNMQ